MRGSHPGRGHTSRSAAPGLAASEPTRPPEALAGTGRSPGPQQGPTETPASVQRLAGRTALVTGAALGLGRATALAMAAEGADVVLFDRCADLPDRVMATAGDLAAVAEAVQRLGRRALCAKGDVRSSEHLTAAVQAARAEFGRLDIVVANAGFGAARAPFWELGEETWGTIVGVNLTGCWLTCRAAAPALIAGGGGAMILVASNFGLKAMAGGAAYVAAKHGVVGLTKALAIDAAPHNIRVNAICPGSMDTEGNRQGAARAGQPFEYWVRQFTGQQLFPAVQSPAEVARVAVWLATDEARYITGHALPVDSGSTLGISSPSRADGASDEEDR